MAVPLCQTVDHIQHGAVICHLVVTDFAHCLHNEENVLYPCMVIEGNGPVWRIVTYWRWNLERAGKRA